MGNKPSATKANSPKGNNVASGSSSSNGDAKTQSEVLMEMCKVPSYSNIDKKVGVIAIGVGSRLRSLMSDLLYTHIGLVELKAIADDSADALEQTKKDFHEFKFECFTDYREALKQFPDVEWVLIGSKNFLHRDHCVAAFEAGKHVFCEKPLAITFEHCEQIQKAHFESGKLFATGFVLRHAPLYQEIRALATDAAKFGKIISVDACENIPPEHGGYIMRNWRRHREESGPHILEKCCHDIDLLLWIIGALPVNIAAFGGTNVFIPENAPTDEASIARYKMWPQAWEDIDPFTSVKNIEDNIVIIMEFKNNVRVTFHANSNSAIPHRRMCVYGTKAAVSGDLYEDSYEYKEVNPDSESISKKIRAVGIHGGGDKLIVDDLAKCMEVKKQPKASGQDALVSTLVCLAIDLARIEKKVVDMVPIWERFNIDVNRSLGDTVEALKPPSITEAPKPLANDEAPKPPIDIVVAAEPPKSEEALVRDKEDIKLLTNNEEASKPHNNPVEPEKPVIAAAQSNTIESQPSTNTDTEKHTVAEVASPAKKEAAEVPAETVKSTIVSEEATATSEEPKGAPASEETKDVPTNNDANDTPASNEANAIPSNNEANAEPTSDEAKVVSNDEANAAPTSEEKVVATSDEANTAPSDEANTAPSDEAAKDEASGNAETKEATVTENAPTGDGETVKASAEGVETASPSGDAKSAN